MGNARKIFLGTVFITLLIIAAFIFSFYQVTEYATLKNIVTGFFSSQFGSEEQKILLMASMEEHCKTNSQIETVLQGGKVVFPCEKIGSNFDSVSGAIFDALYDNKYPCDLFGCLTFFPAILSSRQGNSLLFQLFVVAAFITVISAAAFARHLENPLKGLGLSMLTLIFMYIPLMISPTEFSALNVSVNLSSVIGIFSFNFLALVLVGLVFTAAGFIMERKKPSADMPPQPKELETNNVKKSSKKKKIN